MDEWGEKEKDNGLPGKGETNKGFKQILSKPEGNNQAAKLPTCQKSANNWDAPI